MSDEEVFEDIMDRCLEMLGDTDKTNEEYPGKDDLTTCVYILLQSVLAIAYWLRNFSETAEKLQKNMKKLFKNKKKEKERSKEYFT